MRKVLWALSALLLLVSCQVEIRQFEVVNQSGPYNCSDTGQCEMKVLVLKDGRPLTGYTMTDAANYIFEYEVVGDNGYVHRYRSYLDKAILKGDVVVYPSGYLTFRHTFPSTANYQVFIHFYDYRFNGLWDRIEIPIIINPCYNQRGICANGTCVPVGRFDYRCECADGYVHPADDDRQCLLDRCRGERCNGNGVCHLDGQGEPSCDCFLGYAHGDLNARMAPTVTDGTPDPLSCIPVACDEEGDTTGTVRYMVRPLTVSLQKTAEEQPDEAPREILALDEIRIPEVTQGCEIVNDDEVSGTALGKNSFTEFMKVDRALLARFFYGDISSGTVPFAVKHPHILTRSLLGDTEALSLLDHFKDNPVFAERLQWVTERRLSSCEDYIYKKYLMYNLWLDVFAESSDDPYLIVRFSATPGQACETGSVTEGFGDDRCMGLLSQEDFASSYGGRILYFGARHVAGDPYPVAGFDASKFSLSTSRYVPNNPFVLTAHKKNGYIRQPNDPYWGHPNDFRWHKQMFDLANSEYWKDTYGADIANRHFDRYRLGRELLLELLVNTILFRDLNSTEFDLSDGKEAVKSDLEKISLLGGWLQDVLKKREKNGVWPTLIQDALDKGAPVEGSMKNCYSERYYEKNVECKTVKDPLWSDIPHAYPENVIIESWSILTRNEKDRVLSLLDKKVDTLTSVARYGTQLADRLINGAEDTYDEEIKNDFDLLRRAVQLLNEVKKVDVTGLLDAKIKELLTLAGEAECLKSNAPKEGVSKLQQICGWLPEMFVESVRDDIEHAEPVSEAEAQAFSDGAGDLPPIVNLPAGTPPDIVKAKVKAFSEKSVYDIMQTDHRECRSKIPEPTVDQSSFEKLGDFRDFTCKGSVGQIVTLTYECHFTLDRENDGIHNDVIEGHDYTLTIRNVLKESSTRYNYLFADLDNNYEGRFDLCDEGLNDEQGKRLFLTAYDLLDQEMLLPTLGVRNLCSITCNNAGVNCNKVSHYCTFVGEETIFPEKPEDMGKYHGCLGSGERYFEMTEAIHKYEKDPLCQIQHTSCEYVEDPNITNNDRASVRWRYAQEMSFSTVFRRWFMTSVYEEDIPPYYNYFETAEVMKPEIPFVVDTPRQFFFETAYPDNPRYEVTLTITLNQSGRRAYFDETDLLNGGQVDYAQDLSRFGTYLTHKTQYADYENALLQMNLLANGIYGSSGFSRDATTGRASYSDKRYGYYQFGSREFNVHMGYAYGWGVAGIERFEEFNEFIDSLGGWPEKPGIHDAANLARALDGFYQAEATENDDLLESLAKDFCEREITNGKFNALDPIFQERVSSVLGDFTSINCASTLHTKILQDVCGSEGCNYNDPETIQNIGSFMKENLSYFMPETGDILAGTSDSARDIVNKLALNPYLYGYFGAGAVIFGMPLNAKAASELAGLASRVGDTPSGMTEALQEDANAQNSLWEKNQTELFEAVGYLQLNPNENGIPVPDQTRVEGDSVKRFFENMQEDSKSKLYHMHIYVAGKYLLYLSDKGDIAQVANNFQSKVFTPGQKTPLMTGTGVNANEANDGQDWDPEYDWYFSKRVAEYDLFGVTLTLDAGVFVNYGAKMQIQLGDNRAFTNLKTSTGFVSIPLGQYARGKFSLVPYVDVSAFVEGSASAGIFFASISGTLGIQLDILTAELPLLARYAVEMSETENFLKDPDGSDATCLFFERDCYEGKILDWSKATIAKPYLDMNASMSVSLDILKHSEIYAQADLSVLGITVVDTGKMTLFKDIIPGQMHYEYKVLELPQQFRRIDIEDITQFIR